MPFSSSTQGFGTQNLQVLSFIFKGFMVVLSPFCGWGILKVIFFVFSNPQYFLLLWLVALAIGLVAEVFTETWRPSAHFAARISVRQNNIHTSGEAQTILPQLCDNACPDKPHEVQQVSGLTSPTILFKAQTPVLSEVNVDEYGEEAVEALEVVSQSVELKSNVQSSTADSKSKSKASSPAKPRTFVSKGYGKPVLLRNGKPGIGGPEIVAVLTPPTNQAFDGSLRKTSEASSTNSNENQVPAASEINHISPSFHQADATDKPIAQTIGISSAFLKSAARVIAQLVKHSLHEGVDVDGTARGFLLGETNANIANDTSSDQSETTSTSLPTTGQVSKGLKNDHQDNSKASSQTASKEWGLFMDDNVNGNAKYLARDSEAREHFKNPK